MGFFDQFINSQVGGIGALVGSYRTKPFSTSQNDKFVPALKPGTVILQGPVKPDYVSGGIQGATDSFWTHCLLYAGQEGAELVREKRRNLPSIVQHEFIEATMPKCRIGALATDYLNDKLQMIAFIPPDLTEETLFKILDYAYSRVGTDYNIAKIEAAAFPYFQPGFNPRLHYCSSLCATAYCKGCLSIVPYTVSPAVATPKDIYTELYPRQDWKIAKWNYA